MRRLFALLALAGAALLAAAGGASGQQGVGAIITRQVFESMLSHRGDSGCQGAFYTYDAFIQAAGKFPAFGTIGDDQTRRRELAAFFGQTSHETTGNLHTVDGQLLRGWPFAWGYCRVEEQQRTDPPYYGRGPIQLTHKYNYELAGRALKLDLVSSNPVVAFETAIWFWMTPQAAKPSCHDVITRRWVGGRWQPLLRDPDDRVGFYRMYCEMLGVAEGGNLSCEIQKPYGPTG
ncbi:hypothetical protein SETIT_9G551200v2 [Setaria italica]|uniref:chitinase n=1 Tax=Setaria italica TaxID=4555 RepID=K4AL78_SETIT|nr:hypothetical protein SETIT_9G551200v2 [Setaria italica]